MFIQTFMDFYKLNIRNITEAQIDIIRNRFPKRYWKAMNFRLHDDFLRCIGAYILLRQAFPFIDEKKIGYTDMGKPYIEDALCFNYSHSGEYVVLVTDDKEIGIDIEKIGNRDYKMMQRAFSEEEFKYIEEEDSVNRFLELWTKKESVLKLFGLGINRNLNQINVLPLNESTPTAMLDENVYNKTFIEDGHIISISSFNKFE